MKDGNGNTMVLKKNEDGTYGIGWEGADGKPADAPAGVDFEKGALDSVSSIKIGKVPVGEALLGGTAGLAIVAAVNALMAKTGTRGVEFGIGKLSPALVQFVAALVAMRWGPGLIGKDASFAAAIILAFGATRSALPIDATLSKLTGMIGSPGGAGNGRFVTHQGVDDPTSTNEVTRAAYTNV